MAEPFRIKLEPHERRKGEFVLARAITNTIISGRLAFLFLVPYITLVIWGLNNLLTLSPLWTPQVEDIVGHAVALVQGLSLGAVVGLGALNLSRASAKVDKKVGVTAEQEASQKRLSFALWTALYVFAGTLFWEYLIHSPYSPYAGEDEGEGAWSNSAAIAKIKHLFDASASASAAQSHQPRRPKSDFLRAAEWS